MFKEGDLIRRKKNHIKGYWKGMCERKGFETDAELVVLCHLPAQRVVRFKTPRGGETWVYDYKMELVNFSLENE